MARIKSINITKPCEEPWQQMTPVDDGRHCQSCCKRVTDFSVMSDKDIINYLGRQSNVCGRFDGNQLRRINHQLKSNGQSNGLFKKIGLAAAVVMAIPFARINAQTKHKTEHAPGKSKQHCAGLAKAKGYTAANIIIGPSLQAVSVKPISTEDHVRFEVLGGISVGRITIRRVWYRAWDKTKWVFGGN